MTITVYANQRKLLSTDGVTATVYQSAAEVESVNTDWEGHKAVYGGMGGGIVTLPVRQVMTRKEHRQITSFLKFRQRYDREVIPVLKQEIRQKMMNRFGTMDLETFKSRILVEMQADPRLYIKTRKNQTIKTTVSENAQYQSERNAAWMESIQK